MQLKKWLRKKNNTQTVRNKEVNIRKKKIKIAKNNNSKNNQSPVHQDQGRVQYHH
jgi:hypothetical protein